MRGQSRLASLVESSLNVGTGYIVSLCTWSFFVAPLYGLKTSMGQNAEIAMIFTIISVIRSYLWRRFFNWLHLQSIQQGYRENV